MKFDWKNWNIGGRVIFVATCIATLSMLMKWIDIGFASETGMTQGVFVFLGFWIYPVIVLFKNESMNLKWGMGFSIASLIFTLGYILSKSTNWFGKTMNVSSTGAHLFLLASIALIVGVFMYKPVYIEENNSEQMVGKGD